MEHELQKLDVLNVMATEMRRCGFDKDLNVVIKKVAK
jgi:hypothetical protein